MLRGGRERECGDTTTVFQLCWWRACVMSESISKNDIIGKTQFQPIKYLVLLCLH